MLRKISFIFWNRTVQKGSLWCGFLWPWFDMDTTGQLYHVEERPRRHGAAVVAAPLPEWDQNLRHRTKKYEKREFSGRMHVFRDIRNKRKKWDWSNVWLFTLKIENYKNTHQGNILRVGCANLFLSRRKTIPCASSPISAGSTNVWNKHHIQCPKSPIFLEGSNVLGTQLQST
jgi:hypothetical protein